MAGQTTIRELHFPLGGVDRRRDYQADSDRPREIYTTPWAFNCRPVDVLQRRLRGGSRPGIGLGGSAPPTPNLAVASNTATVYNAATQASSTVTASVGAMPSTFTLGAIYRARLFLSGGDHAIYASRLGDFTDWDYGADSEDLGRATILQLAEAAEIGSNVTALIPHKDSILLAATLGGLWALEGDPVTGRLRNLSRNTGVVGPNAWTKVEDEIVFLSNDGLCAVGAGGGAIKNLSQDKIPNELRNLAGSDVLLAYDPDEQGIYLFDQDATYQWFYDLHAGGFWPMTLATVPDTAAVVDGTLRLGVQGVAYYVGGTETVTSHALLGPLRLASPGSFGQVASLVGTLGSGSVSVTWSLVPGDSAEQAVANALAAIAGTSGYVAATGTFSAGRSHSFYPRTRAPWTVVWLSSAGAWAFESITLESRPAGRWR